MFSISLCNLWDSLTAALNTSADASWLSTFVVAHSKEGGYTKMVLHSFFCVFLFSFITFCHLNHSENKMNSYLNNSNNCVAVHEWFWQWVCLWGPSLSRISTWGTGSTKTLIIYLTNKHIHQMIRFLSYRTIHKCVHMACTLSNSLALPSLAHGRPISEGICSFQ